MISPAGRACTPGRVIRRDTEEVITISGFVGGRAVQMYGSPSMPRNGRRQLGHRSGTGKKKDRVKTAEVPARKRKPKRRKRSRR